jgi:hypothetical protein
MPQNTRLEREQAAIAKSPYRRKTEEEQAVSADQLLAEARGTLDRTQGTADRLAAIDQRGREDAEIRRLEREADITPVAMEALGAVTPIGAMQGLSNFVKAPSVGTGAIAALGLMPYGGAATRLLRGGAKAANMGLDVLRGADAAADVLTRVPKTSKVTAGVGDEALEALRARVYGGGSTDDIVHSTGDWIDTGTDFQRTSSLSSGAHPRGMRPTPAQEVDHVADFADNAEDSFGSKAFDLVDDEPLAMSGGTMDDVTATIRGMNRNVPNAKPRPIENDGGDALDALNAVAKRNMAPAGGRERTAHFANEMRRGTHPATRGAENERFGMGRRRLPELSESELDRISRNIRRVTGG